jgi:hypothetical protein
MPTTAEVRWPLSKYQRRHSSRSSGSGVSAETKNPTTNRTTNAIPAIIAKRAVTEVVLVVAPISDPP